MLGILGAWLTLANKDSLNRDHILFSIECPDGEENIYLSELIQCEQLNIKTLSYIVNNDLIKYQLIGTIKQVAENSKRLPLFSVTAGSVRSYKYGYASAIKKVHRLHETSNS